MKSKKIISGLLALTFVIGGAVIPGAVINNSVVASASTFDRREVLIYGDYEYALLNDGTVEIARYMGLDAKEVEIPAEINGAVVTSIGSSAFSAKSSIVSIKMPDSITAICSDAFAYCTHLSDIKLSVNLTTIGSYAFCSCTSLKSIEIPKSVTYLGWFPFSETRSSLVFNCYKGSIIENYALNNHRHFKILDAEDKTEFPVLNEVQFNTKYHQFRMKWTEVEGAEEYAIAVYLAGKWRVQKQGIPADTTTYTSPKKTDQLQPKAYKVAIGAKINGKWDKVNAINNAFEILV
ncbi:leucine-rich repeat domain-containing protein [Ruminococcus albus]|uniref:Leucine rich repeat-containing protein n=1 Tax=Ruminococcus albus TaxID=1264 RepID=A0A1I1PW92_RUMAL|nr:leucine-rich repeat domain-containing protein [Ruminococcus albus]SFD13922.1 Leucine rich repeat-containing protein [Ruminococcus albus]